MRVISKGIRYIYFAIFRILESALNGRGLFGLFWNFTANFSPVAIWLIIFKNAGLIPKDIRPKINVALVMNIDMILFDFSIWSVIFFAFTLVAAAALYVLCYKRSHKRDIEDIPVELQETRLADLGQTLPDHCMLETCDSNVSDYEVRQKLESRLLSRKPINGFDLAPPVLLFSSMSLLNMVNLFKEPISSSRDLLAWISYVLLHFFAPLLTAIWLYIFHIPGAMSTFSYCLGIQNILGVVTHLAFPTAPPWFITLYGQNATATYDMPGYAAGLTRVDLAWGTHINSSGFHISPIVFGALPSIHSSMAVLVFFFVSYYSYWTIPKIVSGLFVVLQWWSTIYLDHHWRFDLFVGMFYCISCFTLLKSRLLLFEEKFILARLNNDKINGSTMGMRVFDNTSLQKYFDPYF